MPTGTVIYVAVADSAILQSSDGSDWSLFSSDVYWNAVSFGDGYYVGLYKYSASGTSTGLSYSRDGQSWTAPSIYGNGNFYNTDWGNGRFVAVGQDKDSSVYYEHGAAQVSDNGERWVYWHIMIPDYIPYDVCYAMGGYFVAGKYGMIGATDGEKWFTLHDYDNLGSFKGVAYGNDKFVAVGEGGRIFIFKPWEDGTAVSSGVLDNLNDVAYGGGYFVAVGDNGTILISPDGLQWQKVESGTTNRLLGVTYGADSFTVVGEGGIILRSGSTAVGQTGISGSFTWQVSPESGNVPQAEIKVWAAGADRATTEPLVSQLVNVTSEGNFSLADLSPGIYDVTLKLPYTLRFLVQNVVVSQGAMSSVDFGEVVLGDTWGSTDGPDNIIDISDYAAILFSFGSIQGDGNYIDTCDLNRDGIIDVTDYAIVLYNFGKVGETPF